jgi:hypothetical protein
VNHEKGRKLAGGDNVDLMEMKMMSCFVGTANEAIKQVS